jgi:hypothetical protein
MLPKTESAEQRFRSAFERLKEGEPILLPKGTEVSQNNVAKEAGADPSALRKSRYPALIRDIQAWVQSRSLERRKHKIRKERQQRARENFKTQIEVLLGQRDMAQSQLVSAHRQLLELLQLNASLQRRLDKLQPPPSPLIRS